MLKSAYDKLKRWVNKSNKQMDSSGWTTESISKMKPDEYSTTIHPEEVPCQKEAYIFVKDTFLANSDKVLDVGCGLGYGMKILAKKSAEVNGVDVDTKAIAYSTTSLEGTKNIGHLFSYDGYQLPFQDKSIDVITCVDVLEHITDYHRFLNELVRVARKYIIISTPNKRIEFTNRDGTPKNKWHLREWTKNELDKIVKKHSDKIEWHFISGAWDGPFTVGTRLRSDTLVLMPVIKV